MFMPRTKTILWGGQSCPQPPFRRLLRAMRESSELQSPAESRLQPGMAAPQACGIGRFRLPWLLALLPAAATAAPIKVLKLSVTNPAAQAHAAEDIVVPVATLKRLAPDFNAGNAIVTTSDAATLDEDARTLQTIELASQADDLDGDRKSTRPELQSPMYPLFPYTTLFRSNAGNAIVPTSDAATLDEDARTLQTIELASQADDLDGDGKLDELVFQIDLEPHQTRIVTVAYGDQASILRLRSRYPQRTEARLNT